MESGGKRNMANTPNKNTRPRTLNKNKPKQGHKLVWFTLTIISIPCVIIGYVLLTSMGGQDQPVIGNRFQKGDLDPKITEENISAVKDSMKNIGGIEDVTVNLKSATLRVHLNMTDDANDDTCTSALHQAYDLINGILPIDQYFTNRKDGKMYDLEVDAYNYIVDDSHPADLQSYLKLTKTGAGQQVIDNLAFPKDQELVNQITR